MPDLSSQNTSSESFDPQLIEARLNALVGNGNVEEETLEAPDLLSQFLANPELEWLGSRHTDANGSQTVVEYHRLSVQKKQTRLVLHIGFRPDLPTAPLVEANLIDVEGRTRITHVTKFGVRIEITLIQSESAPSTVSLEVICSAAPNTTES